MSQYHFQMFDIYSSVTTYRIEKKDCKVDWWDKIERVSSPRFLVSERLSRGTRSRSRLTGINGFFREKRGREKVEEGGGSLVGYRRQRSLGG